MTRSPKETTQLVDSSTITAGGATDLGDGPAGREHEFLDRHSARTSGPLLERQILDRDRDQARGAKRLFGERLADRYLDQVVGGHSLARDDDLFRTEEVTDRRESEANQATTAREIAAVGSSPLRASSTASAHVSSERPVTRRTAPNSAVVEASASTQPWAPQ